MASLRDIKDSIDSVKKTRKITQAMKMVAASKFKRAQDALKQAGVYGSALDDILSDIASRLEPDNLPALLQPSTGTKTAVIIMAGNRGLCGGFNSYILKKVMAYLSTVSASEVDLHLIGNKSAQFFKSRDYHIASMHTELRDNASESDIAKIMHPIIAAYQDGTYKEVVLFYNEFVSAIANNQIQKTVLPFSLPNWTPQTRLSASDYIYEPSKEVVLNSYLHELLVNQLFRTFLSSKAAEEGSRMAAMDSASQNANDVIYELTLSYNRSRQAAITTEISEIVAGAASLN